MFKGPEPLVKAAPTKNAVFFNIPFLAKHGQWRPRLHMEANQPNAYDMLVFQKAWISSYCLHITCLAKYLMLYREEHYCYTKWILHTPWFDFYVMMGCVPLTAYLWIIKDLKPRILEWLLSYIPFYKNWFNQKCLCRCL